MSEENKPQEGQNPAPEVKPEGATDDKNAKLKGLPVEELVNHILELRQENAKHRTEKSAVSKELEEFTKWKDSQKSELEKLQEENATLKKDLGTTKKEKAQAKVGKAAGLDPDLYEFIKGSSDDEMLASAQKLAEKYPATGGKATPSNVASLLAGNRGVPLSEGKIDANELANQSLRQILNS
jgi:hypothetical protein